MTVCNWGWLWLLAVPFMARAQSQLTVRPSGCVYKAGDDPVWALGITPDAAYSTATVRDNRFTFVSDGVVEADNGQLFGFERTLEISGKSASEIAEAAMLVSVTIGMLRRESSSSPGAILAALNDSLTGNVGGGFVTCCCARFDPDGRVTIASAGHPAPYADGHEVEVEGGLPLGVAPGVVHGETAVSGKHFTFVSDGVVEAENAQRELFGFERTREISGKSAQEIAEAAKTWGQNDDITVVTVRRIPASLIEAGRSEESA